MGSLRVVPVLVLYLLTVIDFSLGEENDSISLPQCISNEECQEHEACMALKCKDPCLGKCQGNSTCEVHDHVPYCACKPGFSGNPFIGCTKQTNCQPTGTSGSKRYIVERFIKVNWYAAIIHCQSHGGRLATIESKEDNDKIKEEIRKTNIRNARFWTAGTNYPLGDWIWMTTGQTFPDFRDWEPGEPNNWRGDENCLEFYEKQKNGYLWNDRKCLDQVQPICEYLE